MGRYNTGLSNNSPNQDEVTPNRELEPPGEDSDSEMEENGDGVWEGYMPLSQNPTEGEPLHELSNESDDEEMNLQESEGAYAVESNDTPASEPKDSSTELVEEVWSKAAPKEVDIEMSDKKIDLVKQVMLNIQLPSEAIPPWAKNIPEDQWKDHLLQRLNKSDK